MRARLHLAQQQAADAETRMAHEDGADACDTGGLAAGVPGRGANQLAVEPGADHLLVHHQVGVVGRVDQADQRGSLLVRDGSCRLRDQRFGVQVAQGREIVDADRRNLDQARNAVGADGFGSRRHTRLSSGSGIAHKLGEG